jgi:phenylpyruvate tautomerase PptA (4-oxalocrotonate tautomerase family)
MFAGRSLDVKRTLYATLVENLEELGIPRDQVMILLREHPTENWGVQGGRAASDVNVGFEINV